MKHLFICSTPLQLITTINMRYTLLKECDYVVLYLTNHVHSHEVMYRKAIESECFNEVHLIKTFEFNQKTSWMTKYRVTAYIFRGYEYFNAKYITRNFIEDSNIYNYFWVGFMDRSSWYIYLIYKKRNFNLKLSFFEDGIASYTFLSEKQNKLDKRLSNLFGYKALYEEIDSFYIYDPTLIKNNLHSNITIKPLQKIMSSTVCEQILKVFPVNKKDMKLLDSRYIFFDQKHSLKIVQDEQLKIIIHLAKVLKEEFCLKLHPATLLDVDRLKDLIVKTDKPLEVICLKEDISNHILISIFSTVGISPKLMFDQSPKIIFLYKLINMDGVWSTNGNQYKFMELFIDKYKDSNMVFVPETMEELECIFLKLEKNKL